MSTQAMLADSLLRLDGHGGLWEWAMDQRRSVKPANWDEVAKRLALATDGKVQVQGVMLRRWVIAAEAERNAAVGAGSERGAVASEGEE